MRPLLLFLAVLLAFFAILKFYPAGEGAGVAAGEAPRTDAGFLSRPAGDGAAPLRPNAATTDGARLIPVLPDPRPEPSTSTPAARGGEPAGGAKWLDEFEGVARAGVDEITLAAAMLHDRCQGLADRIARLGERMPEDRGRLLLSFGNAYRGDLQRAKEVAQGISGAIPEMEERFLRAMMEGGRPPLRPNAALGYGPAVLAMSMLTTERLVDEDIAARGWASAARGLSDLLLAEIDAPWPSSRPRLLEWSRRLAEVQDRHRWNPRGVWPAREVSVERGDSLSTVLGRFREQNPGLRVSTGLVARVNGIERGLIHPGDVLKIPMDPVSVRVDLGSRLVLALMGEEVAAAWECAIGAEGQETVAGDYTAGFFQENPPHWVKGQGMIPFGHPDNPLGTRWIAWHDADGSKNNLGLGFHGTDAPQTVGSAASKGCVRLRNAEVEELYAVLPRLAPIRVE